MHLDCAAVFAVIGVLAGAPLARLRVLLPAGRASLAGAPDDWWLGRGASLRARAGMAAAAAVVLGALGARMGWRGDLAAFAALGLAGVALATIDVAHHRLPDLLTYPCYPVTLGVFALTAARGGSPGSLSHAVIAMAAVGVLFVGLAAVGGIGFGDAKLAGVLALCLGWLSARCLLLGFFSGFALGAVAAAAMIVARRARWRSEIAFGPALLAGCLATVLALPEG